MPPRKQVKAVPTKPTTATLLSGLKSGATRKETKPKEDERPIIVIDDTDFADLVRLSTLIGELQPTYDERQKEVKGRLFERFTDDWFRAKRPPKNPRIVLRKKDSKGNTTLSDDMSFMFIVKYREEGLKKVVPNVEDIPEGMTVEDVLVDMLISPAVGISEENALALLGDDGDIKVIQKLELSGSLDTLLESSDSSTKSAAEKLVAFLSASEDDDSDEPIDVLNDDEKKKLLTTVQVVSLKEGFFERACKYVESAEELRKLLTFVKATLQVSSYEFAIGDSPVDRQKRLIDAAVQFIGASEE